MPAIPVPGQIELQIRSEDGNIRGTVTDRLLSLNKSVRHLGEFEQIQFATPQYCVVKGKKVEGIISDLKEVPVSLGSTDITVDLSQATEIRLTPLQPRTDISSLKYKLVAISNGMELVQSNGTITIQSKTSNTSKKSNAVQPKEMNAKKSVTGKPPKTIHDIAGTRRRGDLS